MVIFDSSLRLDTFSWVKEEIESPGSASVECWRQKWNKFFGQEDRVIEKKFDAWITKSPPFSSYWRLTAWEKIIRPYKRGLKEIMGLLYDFCSGLPLLQCVLSHHNRPRSRRNWVILSLLDWERTETVVYEI